MALLGLPRLHVLVLVVSLVASRTTLRQLLPRLVVLIVTIGVTLRTNDILLRVDISKVFLLAHPDFSRLHLATLALSLLVEVQLWSVEGVWLLLVCSWSSCLLCLAFYF